MKRNSIQHLSQRSGQSFKQIIFSVCFLGLFITGNSQNFILWSENQGSTALPTKTYCATDLIGNIYEASSVNGSALDWIVTSYRPDSVMRWTYSYSGSANLNDIVTGIVVDSFFNVYVCGTTEENSTDITVVKLDSAGAKQWVVNYDSGGEVDLSSGITELGGHIYLSGSSYSSTTGYNYRVVKISKTGSFLWTAQFNGSGNGDDFVSDIVVDSLGGVYLTGSSVRSDGSTDILTMKYNTSGTLVWSKYFGLASGKNDMGVALSTGDDGHVYVVGQSYLSTSNSDIVTIRYHAATGTQKWVARYNGTYGGIDKAADVLALNGAIFVVGSSETSANNMNFVTLKYNPGGKVKWMQLYNGPVNGNDECRVLIEDGDDIVVSGRSMGIKNFDVTTISYGKEHGTINWTIRYDAPFGGAEDVSGIARDEMGNIVLGCFSQVDIFSYSSQTLKIYQKAKNDQQIAECLRQLAIGFSGMSSDTVFRRVLWYNILRGFDDSLYLIRANDLRLLADQAGISATGTINIQISSENSWNQDFNWCEIIIRKMWIGSYKVDPLLNAPLLHEYTKEQYVSDNSSSAYTHTEFAFPINCVNCVGATLTHEDLASKSAWIFSVNLPLFVFGSPQSKGITNCFLGGSMLFPTPCEVCNISSTPNYISGQFHSPASHEIGIWLDLDQSGVCNTVLDANTFDDIASVSSNEYAVLEALPGNYWHKVEDSNQEIILYKSVVPHISDAQGAFPTGLAVEFLT